MKNSAAAKKLLSLISVFLLGLGSSGCTGKIFSSMLQDDNTQLLALLVAVENIDPAVTAITSTTTNGLYKAGDVIDIRVQFNRPVILSGGTLTVELDSNGGTPPVSVSAVTYPSQVLIGTYTVDIEDASNDLDSLSLTLGSGATLTDQRGVDCSLDFTNHGLANNKDIIIDGVLPTVAFTSTPPINIANEASYTVTGTCSENGRTVTVAISDGVPAHTVNATPTCSAGAFTTGSLDATALNEGGVTITADHTDAAGNDAVQASTSVTKNTNAPTVSFSSTPVINNSNETNYEISGDCSEVGQDVDIIISDGTNTVNASPVCDSSLTFTASSLNVSTIDDDTAVSITADHEDTEGNPAVQASTTVLKDTINPTVALTSTPTIFSGNVTSYTVGGTCSENGQQVSVSINGALYATPQCTSGAFGTVPLNVSSVPEGLSISVTAGHSDVAGNTDLDATTVVKDTISPTVAITSTAPNPTNANIPITITFNENVTGFVAGEITVGNGSVGALAGGPAVYTTTITPAGQGAVTVNVAAGVAQDSAGNTNTAATQLSRTYDSIAPTVTITSTAPDPTNQAIPITITFNENVTGFILSDITVGNGTAGSFAGGPAVYTATITPAGVGTVTVDVNASVAQDAAGNNNTAATQLTRYYDNVRPTVTITSTAPDPTNETIPVTITFSSSVTGFIVDDITVTNGSAGSFAGGPAVYTATITPSGQGEVTVQVADSVAQDTALNWNTASNELSRTYDTVGPTVLIETTAPNPTNANIPITITFNEDVTGFIVDDITVGNGSAGSFAGGPAVYTATITPSGQGAVTVDVASGVAQDEAGNDNSAATQLSRTYDSVGPTVLIETTAPNPTNAAIPVTITFNEDVTGFVVGDITVGNGSAGSFAGGPAVYTATITPSGQGTVTVDVNASVAQDAAGNYNSAATQLSRTYDSVGPTVSITTTAPNPTNANIPITITFNENVTGFVAGDITVGNGSVGTLSGGPAVYTTTITPAGQGTVTVDVASGVAQDAAGNNNSAATQLTRTYDTVAPVINTAETMDVDHDGKIDYYKLTFSKNVKDSTFPGYIANSLGNSQTAWLVSGYSGVVLAHGTAAPESDSTNDTVLYLKFDEISSGYDTGVKPDLTTTATPGLTDMVGTSGNVIAQVITASVTETDKAAPIIVSARGVTGETSMSIVFSEEVDPNGSTGACSSSLTTAAFTYTNASSGGVTGISSMGSDASACGDSTVTVTLNTALTEGDLTPTPDTIRAVASAILDMNNNAVPSTINVAIAGAISPYVLGVTATGARKIQITYSEPVVNGTGATGAQNLSNYTLSVDNAPVFPCVGGSDTVNLTGTVTEVVANEVFELSTDADQCPTTTYRLTVANVVDIDDAVVIKPPLFDTFLGNERLKVSSATCLTTTTMNVVFNKPVEDGTGAGGAETTTRYKFTGATNLGSLSSAVRGTGGNTNRVTLTHAVAQTGATYTVIGSNATNGDGFDDSSYGAIQNDDLSESLQLSPRDRAPWSGCGTAIDQFAQGPISVDPFGDGSDFGYLASYNSRVYIGPNINGNAATRMEADGTNPSTVYFEFTQDTNSDGGGTHRNTATTRDGGVAVPPYVTIGHTGCTENNADLNTGCGPDNENGRGVFSVGTIGTTSYIFLGGARSAENFDYVYYSADTDVTLNYKYVDMGTITGSVTQGLSSIAVFYDRVYVGMAKVNYGGTGRNAPDFGRINFTSSSGEGTECTAGSDCDATDADGGKRMFINCIASFGGTDQYVDQSNDNYAYYVGVDALYVYKNQLYAANGGYNQLNHNGGVIRSTNTFPAAYAGEDGENCNGGDWALITPSATAWHNSPTNNRFSLELTKISDLIPQNKAVAGFAEHENNLYMARTACSVANGTRTSERDSEGYVTGCTLYTGDYTSNRRPQLWKCVPGGDNVCDAGDWSLIDSNSDGITNMGDSDNHSMTLIVKNGSYLYVGFDNLNDGVRIYRTNATNPTENDFTLIGTAGLGDPTNIKEIYSAISIQSGTDYYIYVSAGRNATPVSVYRQVNQ